MRIYPVVLFYLNNPTDCIEFAGHSSLVTHKSNLCKDACRFLAGILYGAIKDVPKETLLSKNWAPTEGYWDENPLAKKIQVIAEGNYKKHKPGELKSSGNVLDTLNLVLNAFYSTDTFGDGFEIVRTNCTKESKALNVYGMLAGAYYGYSSLIKHYNQIYGRLQLRLWIWTFYCLINKYELCPYPEQFGKDLKYYEDRRPKEVPQPFVQTDPDILRFKKMSIY